MGQTHDQGKLGCLHGVYNIWVGRTRLPTHALLPVPTKHTLYLLFKVRSAASKTKNSMSYSRHEGLSTSNKEGKSCLIMRVVQGHNTKWQSLRYLALIHGKYEAVCVNQRHTGVVHPIGHLQLSLRDELVLEGKLGKSR